MTQPTEKTKIAAIYMRFSNKKQTEYSIKNQYHNIKQYADSNGYSIVDIFIDRAKTGTNEKRKDFDELVKQLKSGKKWDAILVYHTSRLARRTSTSFGTHDFANLNETPIIFTSQPQCNGYDTATILTRGIQFVIDENQSLTNSDFTHGTMCIKAKSGAFLGGTPPLGYDVSEYKLRSGKERKELIINEREAFTVRKIFSMYLAGVSYSDMANELNRLGLKTKRGGKFYKNSFYEILTRKKYIGTYTWNTAPGTDSLRKRFQPKGDYPIEEQICAKNKCPAIISEEQFELVQKKLQNSKYGKSSAKNRAYYLLSGMGILKCSICGATMCGETVTSHGKQYKTYHCPNHKKGLCPTKSIKEDKLDNFVVRAIIRETLAHKSVKELNDLIFTRQYKVGIKEHKKMLENKVKNLSTAIEYNASEHLLEQLKKCDDALKRINEKIRLGGYVIEIKPTEKKTFLRDVIKYIKNSTSVDVRLFLHSIINKILVSNDDITLSLNIA